MAVTPGILYVSNQHGQGGLPAVNALFSLVNPNPLQFYNDPRLMQCVPCLADGSEPASPAFYPWYDGAAGTAYTVASTTANSVTFTGSPGFTVNEFAGRVAT